MRDARRAGKKHASASEVKLEFATKPWKRGNNAFLNTNEQTMLDSAVHFPLVGHEPQKRYR
jgi:hypothetical protein